jgi:hypothetical protein
MILKCRKKEEGKLKSIIGNYEFTDNIMNIEVQDNYIYGYWNKETDRKFEVIKELYEEIYLLNDKGQTIERLL